MDRFNTNDDFDYHDDKDFDFDTWFNIFIDKCKALGYNGPIDKYTFESDWEQNQTPEYSAEQFVKEMNEPDKSGTRNPNRFEDDFEPMD